MSRFDAPRTALIVQDMQNDVVTEGGAFADAGPATHAAKQGTVENLRALADDLKQAGGHVVHVWYVVAPGAADQRACAPLFQGLIDSGAMVRGTWGAAPVENLVPRDDEHVVEKNRMNPFVSSRLEPLLRALGVDTLISAGALTNMAVEHTARHAADAGFRVVLPSDATATFDDEWQHASTEFAIQNVATVMLTRELRDALS
ncbi:cysteine hydrolase [Egibacter rhizosphaerae]|uniref:cysteine hydrolase n=1 Tax=Egibacter rhizosphaerae TaxID=1670831 RepID=UPI00197AA5E0|nr:cysteine hydrolase [Egibacter rhizosphaerae]